MTSVEVSDDNKYVVSGSKDKSIKVFDFATKQEVHHFTNAHESRPSPLLYMIPDLYLV